MAIHRGYARSLGLVAFSVLMAIFGIGLKAQETTAPSLEDFVGTYADTPGHPVVVAIGHGPGEGQRRCHFMPYWSSTSSSNS